MTAAELRTEYDYRRNERLAILSDSQPDKVTESMLAIAVKEASDWLKDCPHAVREQQTLI